MQVALEMDTSYEGLTQEERRMICQQFDKTVEEDTAIQEPSLEATSTRGGKK